MEGVSPNAMIDFTPSFDLAEARALLPALQRMTAAAAVRVEVALCESDDDEEQGALARRIDGVFTAWRDAVELLGARSAGLWTVEFFNGDGWYCWRWPEPDVVRYRPAEERGGDGHLLQ